MCGDIFVDAVDFGNPRRAKDTVNFEKLEWRYIQRFDILKDVIEKYEIQVNPYKPPERKPCLEISCNENVIPNAVDEIAVIYQHLARSHIVQKVVDIPRGQIV